MPCLINFIDSNGRRLWVNPHQVAMLEEVVYEPDGLVTRIHLSSEVIEVPERADVVVGRLNRSLDESR